MNLFKKIKFNSGILPDDRKPEEKSKDYLTSEVLMSAQPLEWVDWDTWRGKALATIIRAK